MAQVANTVSTTASRGQREDLIDAIYNVDPFETPVLTNAPKTRASAVNHEWQTDTLAAASATNAQIEGDDADFSSAARPQTVRLGNRTQISRKIVSVTGTQEEVLKAGRRSELAKELLKMGRELRRDMESSLTANNGKITGTNVLAAEIAGFGAWFATNTSLGAGGADPGLVNGFTDGTGVGAGIGRTDGTPRAFTEALLQTVIRECWDSGGNPNWIMTGSANKQNLSAFSGIATKFQNVENRVIMAGADIYVSDFGRLVAIANRFQRARDVFVIQRDMWAVSFLRNIRLLELARTGDAEKRMLVVEYTMEARNERSSGAIFDLTTV